MALDCAPLAVFLLNRHGYLLVAAGGALRHFDIDAGTAVGRPMVELLGDDNVTRDRVARALAGEPVEWSMVIGRQRLDLRFSAWPQDTDVPAVIVGVASESAVGPRG